MGCLSAFVGRVALNAWRGIVSGIPQLTGGHSL